MLVHVHSVLQIMRNFDNVVPVLIFIAFGATPAPAPALWYRFSVL